MPTPVIAALIGLAAGIVGGLFGVGGGIVIVPGLVLALGFSQVRAAATSTAVIIGVAAAAVIPFATADLVRWDLAAWLFAGSSLGAVAGARLLDRVDEARLRYAFAGFLILAALRLLVSA